MVALSPIPSPECSGAVPVPAGMAVVAFGGNAILRCGQRGTISEQADNLSEMARQLSGMIASGWSVVVTHGNGPQVGNIKLQQDRAEPEVPGMPLDVCGAMSQGQIGYMLQQSLSAEFARQGIERTVTTVLTRCVVDPADGAFEHPSKPIGPFYDEDTARQLELEKGWEIVLDSARGYRRVVPSPAPGRILESESIRLLARSGVVVIASGGGGVPVIPCGDGGYSGVEAVIDKDLASCLLALEMGADALILLTEVSEVQVHFGTPRQAPLGNVSLSRIKEYATAGHFPSGSMGPKVQAGIQFVSGGGRLAIITSPQRLSESLLGKAGTRVQPDGPGRVVEAAS